MAPLFVLPDADHTTHPIACPGNPAEVRVQGGSTQGMPLPP